MKEKIIKTYRVRDLGEAAVLYTLHRKLLELSRQDHNLYWFVFEDNDDCQTYINQYWRKELLVNAKHFYDSVKTLKNLLFDTKDRDRHVT